MDRIFDTAIVGLGAMGSAAAFHLARRGRSVLGLDRFTPPHTSGSSHGQTRIIREAYFEHPLYVPLVQRAYVLWDELQRASGRALLTITGGLSIGRPDGILFAGARRSVDEHRLAHEILTAAEIAARFPALCPDADMMAVWEPRAGILAPEACIAAHLELARGHGATLHFDEPVLHWHPEVEALRVVTARGEYRARKLVLSAGAWVGALAGDPTLAVEVERQVLYWFEPRANAPSFAPERCPIHLWEAAPRSYFDGFPELGSGVKVAIHHAGERCDPDRLRREVSAGEVAGMRSLLKRFLPDADGPLRETAVCMYTNTRDEHFWIDAHAQDARVLVASPCSGHGFKFASAIGEVLADLLTEGRCRFDLGLFRRR